MLAFYFAVIALVAAENTWSNWDDRQVCHPQQIIHAASEADIVNAVALARSRNASLKVAGDGHSFSPIVLTPGLLVTIDNFNKIVSSTSDTVIVQAGTRLYAINSYLESRGRALANLGAICMQTIAGIFVFMLV